MSFAKLVILLTAMLFAGSDILATFLQSPTFKVDVRVVNVLATVRERKGRIVNDLAKEDFILEEDGKPQQILYFSRQTDLPLIIGLLVDTSWSQQTLIEDERRASVQFLDDVLRPDYDRAFLIKFDFEAELLQDLTNSKYLLRKALGALKARSPYPQWQGRNGPNFFAQRRSGGGRQGGPGGGRVPFGGTILYDSVFLASDEVLRKQEGRKAIILISDGVDNASKLGQSESIEAAQRADAIVYSIRYFDSDAYNQYGGGTIFGRSSEDKQGEAALKSLSLETGGRAFEVTRKLKLKDIYGLIQEELRNQYHLGYTPPENSGAGYHRISLRTKIPNMEVITRAGYYAKK
jgi:VWFA-related protein